MRLVNRFEGGRGGWKGASHGVTPLSRAAPILGAYCAFPCSLPPPTGCFVLSARRGAKKYLVLSSFSMAAAVVDPLQTLSAALAAPPDSREQADLLTTLRESLEARPQPIPILCTTLLKNVTGPNDSLLKRWVLDLLHFAICRSSLNIEVRTNR